MTRDGNGTYSISIKDPMRLERLAERLRRLGLQPSIDTTRGRLALHLGPRTIARVSHHARTAPRDTPLVELDAPLSLRAFVTLILETPT